MSMLKAMIVQGRLGNPGAHRAYCKIPFSPAVHIIPFLRLPIFDFAPEPAIPAPQRFLVCSCIFVFRIVAAEAYLTCFVAPSPRVNSHCLINDRPIEILPSYHGNRPLNPGRRNIPSSPKSSTSSTSERYSIISLLQPHRFICLHGAHFTKLISEPPHHRITIDGPFSLVDYPNDGFAFKPSF